MQQNDSLGVMIGLNVNALSDGKSLHLHGHRSVAMGILHWSPNRIRHSHSLFIFTLRTSGILALFEQICRYTGLLFMTGVSAFRQTSYVTHCHYPHYGYFFGSHFDSCEYSQIESFI